jgi:hypothetical protein
MIVTLRLDPDLVDGLQAVWHRDGIQQSEQVRRAVRAWLEDKGVMQKRVERKREAVRKRSLRGGVRSLAKRSLCNSSSVNDLAVLQMFFELPSSACLRAFGRVQKL